jgi:hypothetical protein
MGAVRGRAQRDRAARRRYELGACTHKSRLSGNRWLMSALSLHNRRVDCGSAVIVDLDDPRPKFGVLT